MCNGLRIAEPSDYLMDAEIQWPTETQLKRPSIAVVDSAANLPLTIQRYRLSRENLPFIDELTRDVTLSFVAHALVCGPASLHEGSTVDRGFNHPLLENGFETSRHQAAPFVLGRLRWCTTLSAVISVDPWLYTLLRPGSCIVFGALYMAPFTRLPQQEL
jgi:hypothetical protein